MPGTAPPAFPWRTALVTGATGFIGQHVVRRLIASGCAVHAVARRPLCAATADPFPAARLHLVDLTDAGAVAALFGEIRPELVVHLAARVNGRRDLDEVLPMFRDTLAATVHVLNAATVCKARRVLLAGSLEEPSDTGLPDGPGAESAPVSPYAAAKGAARMYARLYHALYGLDVTTLRLFMVYGPGQNDADKLVPSMVRSLLRGEAPRLTSGTRPVDWVYVEDVAGALQAAAARRGPGGASLDIGSGTLTTVRDFALRLAAIVGTGPAPIFGALPDRPAERVVAADTGPAREHLGWTATTSLDEGLRRTVAWYRAQPGMAGA